ncbi:MAG: hypothetical protein GWP19_02790 [Planctomycetia bacterium]|nr:hypothetical protein [Planctomycetia bacterium]
MKLFIILITLWFPLSSQVVETTPGYEWELVQEEAISSSLRALVWSKPSRDKSSRLIYYKRPAAGYKKKYEFMNKDNETAIFGGPFLTGTETLMQGKRAILRGTLTLDGVPVDHIPEGEHGKWHYQIVDFNNNVLANVDFNKPSVKFFAAFDGGEFAGIDYNKRELHLVIPSKNIYKVISVSKVPLGYDYGYEDLGDNGDLHFDWRDARFHIILNSDGEILWKRETKDFTYVISSNDGQRMALIKHKETRARGEIEIVDRYGNTICEFNSEYSVSRDFFTPDNQRIILVSSHDYKKINFYDTNTGDLINTMVFRGFHPVKEVTYSPEKDLLFVMHSYPSTKEGNRYISVFPVIGSAKEPLWKYDLGPFNIYDGEFDTHLSVSNDGTEITTYSNGSLKIFRIRQ